METTLAGNKKENVVSAAFLMNVVCSAILLLERLRVWSHELSCQSQCYDCRRVSVRCDASNCDSSRIDALSGIPAKFVFKTQSYIMSKVDERVRDWTCQCLQAHADDIDIAVELQTNSSPSWPSIYLSARNCQVTSISTITKNHPNFSFLTLIAGRRSRICLLLSQTTVLMVSSTMTSLRSWHACKVWSTQDR